MSILAKPDCSWKQHFIYLSTYLFIYLGSIFLSKLLKKRKKTQKTKPKINLWAIKWKCSFEILTQSERWWCTFAFHMDVFITKYISADFWKQGRWSCALGESSGSCSGWQPCHPGEERFGNVAHSGCAHRNPIQELKNLLTAHLFTCRRFHYGRLRSETNLKVAASHHFISCNLPCLEFTGLDSDRLLLRSYMRVEVVCVCVCVLPRLSESTRETSMKRVTGFDINQQDCIAAIIRQ